MDTQQAERTFTPELGGFLICLVLAMCALFTLCGALFLVLYLGGGGTGASDPGLLAGVALRALLAALVLGVALAGVWGLRGAAAAPVAQAVDGAAFGAVHAAGLGLVLCLAALVLLPRLAAYPWAAPDEVHHLGVAKNLAVHNAYASGSPEQGFHYFDPYDSVGPAVLAPVAGAFKLFGVSVGGARVVVACFFLALCAGLFLLAAPVLGPGAALAGTAFVPMAYSSIYLGRTLYGEAPALAYFVFGLVCWRASIRREAAVRWGLAAGVLFGLAVLSKTIMVLAAFPMLGAVVLDGLSVRRVGYTQLLSPVAGGLAVVGAWWFVQFWAQSSVQESAGATMGLYQHYLLFGVEPVLQNLGRSFLAYPLGHLAAAAGMVFGAGLCFRRAYSPALAVLWLLAVFYAYWWTFFTPGQLPRYLWASYAVAALFAGGLCWRLLTAGFRARGAVRRIGAAVAAVLVAAPYAFWTCGQAAEVYRNSEMLDDYAVAQYVEELPESVAIATSFWPLQGTLRLLAGRDAEVVASISEGLASHDIVLALADAAGPSLEQAGTIRQNLGRYVILRRWEQPAELE